MPHETPPPGEIDQPPTPKSFFDRVLAEHPEIDRQKAAIAPSSILKLIGGSNTRGIPIDVDRAANLGIGARKIEETGTPDDTGIQRVNPSDLIGPGTSDVLSAVGGFLNEGERQATTNFPYALDEARAFIKQRRTEEKETEFLFIQGEVWIDDRGTDKRLRKLAQALGIPVGYIYYERNTFNRTLEQFQRGEGVDYIYGTAISHPPVGRTADDYWDRITEERKPRGYEDTRPLETSPRYYADIATLLQVKRPNVGDDFWMHPSSEDEAQMHQWSTAQRAAFEKLGQLSRLGIPERSAILSIIGREQFVTALEDVIAGSEIFSDNDTIVFGIALEVLGQIDQRRRFDFSLGLIEKLASTQSSSGNRTELDDTSGSGNFADFMYKMHTYLHAFADQLESPERQRATKALRALAFRKEKNTDNARITAREILAELGDVDTRNRLLAEARDEERIDRAHFAIGEPLAIYLRTDTQLTDRLIGRVNALVKASTYTFESDRLITALMLSGRPEVSKFIGQLLTADAKDQSFSLNIAFPIFMYIDKYIAALQKYPESADKQAALDGLGSTLDAFLTLCNTSPQDSRLQHKIPFGGIQATVADAIMNIGDSKKSRELLQQQVIDTFIRGGQILDNKGFQGVYLKYRELYGPIPDIDQFVIRP